MELLPRNCPQCASENRSREYALAEGEICKCSDCNFVYLPVAADLSYLTEGEGAWENSLATHTAARLKSAPVRTRLSLATRFRTKFRKKSPVTFIMDHFAATAEPINVLDVGCGNGVYLLSLSENFVPFGVELSKGLAEEANQNFAGRGGYVVHSSAAMGLQKFEPRSMDAVVMRSYLEHDAEPLQVLTACQKILKPGGMAVVKVPNYGSVNRQIMGKNWCGIRYPDHLNYFTPQSLEAMAKKAGFRVDQSFLNRLPTSDNMWAVFKPEI